MPTSEIPASHTSVLDFDVRCRCGVMAEAFFEIHPVDYCTPDRRTWSALLCRGCLARDVMRVQRIVLSGPLWCSSCGGQIVTLSDMIVKLCPLWVLGEEIP